MYNDINKIINKIKLRRKTMKTLTNTLSTSLAMLSLAMTACLCTLGLGMYGSWSTLTNLSKGEGGI